MDADAGAPFVLSLNAGSSSLKFAVFRVRQGAEPVLSGVIDRIAAAPSELKINVPGEASRHEAVFAPDHASGLDLVLDGIRKAIGVTSFVGVGHRVVHGGERYAAPQAVDHALLEELKRLSPLSPEHLPAELELIESLAGRLPNQPQIACFDTAFHRELPREARLLPIPRRYESAGVRRFGFHGLSYEFLMEELVRLGEPAATKGKVILAHLGNGASMAAVQAGKCIDTSMAFTPAAGLIMGRRSGDLDPGLPDYLARTEGMNPAQFHEMVNYRSGLLGVSETTSDMRELIALEKSDPRAADAIALFCYQAKKWLGAFAAALGGLDTLVFAGGIGENAPPVRARICDGLGFLGLELSEPRNATNASLISTDPSRVAVRVIRTDEEQMIARSVCRVLGLAVG